MTLVLDLNESQTSERDRHGHRGCSEDSRGCLEERRINLSGIEKDRATKVQQRRSSLSGVWKIQ